MGYATDLHDLPRLAARDAWGESVTYTPSAGAARTVVGIHRVEPITLLDAQGMAVDTTREVLDFRDLDLALVSISPRSRDTVVMRGVNYTVIGVERPCDGTTLCVIGRAR